MRRVWGLFRGWSPLLLLALATAARADETVLPNASLLAPLQSAGIAARALGMGGAFVGVADDASSLGWNPAGLASLDRNEIVLHHNSYLLDGAQESLDLGWPLGGGRTLGLGVDWTGYGSFTDRDAAGQNLGTSTAYDLGAKLAWAQRWTERLHAGVAASVLTQALGSQSYQSYAVDLGLTWDFLPAWRLGASVLNLGASDGGLQRDAVYRAGLSYLLQTSTDFESLPALAASVDAGGTVKIQAGLEERLRGLLALRAGYELSLAQYRVDGFSGLSLGFGLQHADWRLDYAYLPYGGLGASQRLSLGKRFDTQALKEALTPSPEEAGPWYLCSAGYVGVSVGGSYASAYQPAALTDWLNQLGFSPSAPASLGLSGSLWGGYQSSSGVVVEAGTQINPTRDYGFSVKNSLVEISFSSHYLDLVFYSLVGYRWLAGRNLFTAGARVQDHLLLGDDLFTTKILGVSSATPGSFQASGVGLGPALRWERPLGSKASVGLELGYDTILTVANPASQAQGGGASKSGTNPFDYSGLYARVSLAGWFSPPLSRADPDAALAPPPPMLNAIPTPAPAVVAPAGLSGSAQDAPVQLP